MSLLLEYLLLERLLSIISMTLTCCLWAGSWLPWRLRSGIFTRDLTELLEGATVSETQLSSVCEDTLFLILTQNVAQYDLVGPYLGMNETDLIQIKRDRDSECTRMLAVLWKWRTRNGSNATYRALILVFLQMGNREIAELILKHIKEENGRKNSVVVTSPFTPDMAPGKYLNWSEMGDDEKERVRNDLLDRCNKVRQSFASLLVKLVQSFKREQVNVEELKLYLSHLPHLDSDPDSLKHLNETDDIAKIFRYLIKNYSWYNYELLEEVVDTFGTKEDQALVSNYSQSVLLPYLKCSIFEIPPSSFDNISDHVRHQLCLKLSDSVLPTGSDVKLLQEKLAKRLKLSLSCFQLMSYGTGCVELHFGICQEVAPVDLESLAVYDNDKNAYLVSVDIIDILFATEAPRELEILRKLLSNTENKQDESNNSGHFGGDDDLVTSTSTTSTERKDSTCSTGSVLKDEAKIHSPSFPSKAQVDQSQVSHKISEHTKTLANTLTKVQEVNSARKIKVPNETFTMIGGKNVGIFVSSATFCSTHQITIGDQILEINGHDTSGMSLYDATQVVKETSADIQLTVITNKSKYLVALGHLEADSFYLQCIVRHEPSTKYDARLRPGIILRVINTYLYSNHWLAWVVDKQTGLESALKRVPNPCMAKIHFGSDIYFQVQESSLPFKRTMMYSSNDKGSKYNSEMESKC